MIDSPVALLALLGVVVAAPALARRFRTATPHGLRVVARTALSRNAVVAVIAVGDRHLLVGSGEQGVQLLTELDADLDTVLAGHTDASGTIANTTDSTVSSVNGTGANLTTSGPRIGPMNRLREWTIRTSSPTGSPIRALRH